MFVELYLHIYAGLVVKNPLWYDQAKPKILLSSWYVEFLSAVLAMRSRAIQEMFSNE